MLELGRLRYPRLYDMDWDKPPALVPRYLRLEVLERIDFRGGVVTALDMTTVAVATDKLLAAGVDSIAICLLNSYANAGHEQAIAAYISSRAPAIELSVSSDVLPEVKEFERTSTTVINAYVKPVVARYLTALERRLLEMDFRAPVTVMQPSGGTVRTEVARARPVYSIESGPAAGGSGRGCARPASRYRQSYFIRYGWHHRENLPHREWCSTAHQRVRSRRRHEYRSPALARWRILAAGARD